MAAVIISSPDPITGLAETAIPGTYGESLRRRQGVGSRLDFPITGVLFQAFASNIGMDNSNVNAEGKRGPMTQYFSDPGFELDTLVDEAMDLYCKGKYYTATNVMKKALALAESNLGPEHPDVATCLYDIGLLYRLQGRHEKAEPFYRRSLAIREKVFGLEHPDVALTLECLASLYRESKRGEDAEVLEKRAARIREIKR